MLVAMPTRMAWQRWTTDPVAAATGVSFDRSPAGEIRAPTGLLRVCAYHIDFDERPVCYVDVATLAEAEQLCEALGERCRFNVDYALIYDERGEQLNRRPW